jgi:uncharacterized lipoprotein YddW (UPF0748 family)
VQPVDRRSFVRVSTGAMAAVVATVPLTAHAEGSPAHSPETGTHAPTGPTDTGTAAPVRQLRAMWISSVENIDWPTKPGLSVKEQKEEFTGLLDLAQDLGLNAVISQVRPAADAFWPSRYEPFSQYLTGTQGKDPGYDPLEFQIREAHARNLEFHAWFNPYRVSMGEDPSDLIEEHPARTHPEWVFPYGGKLYYNPGIPAVRGFVQDAMMDAVRRYDIDGVHFDDYFYPYPVEGEDVPDEDTYDEFSDGSTPVEDWRRENIDRLIQEMGEKIHRAKPWVRFGVSPFGIWRNASSDPDGSATSGSESYDIISADTRLWVQRAWVDYINPQVYWEIGHDLADYDTLAHWWAQTVDGTGVALFIGEAAYKAIDGTFEEPTELRSHLDLDAEIDGVDGNVYFSAASLRDDKTGAVKDLVDHHYTRPALVPVISRVPGHAPAAPHLLSARRTRKGVRLRWKGTGHGTTSYALWRIPRHLDVETALEDGRNLIVSLRAGHGVQEYLDKDADGKGRYVVTALDRTWRQSRPSRSRRVTH